MQYLLVKKYFVYSTPNISPPYTALPMPLLPSTMYDNIAYVVLKAETVVRVQSRTIEIFLMYLSDIDTVTVRLKEPTHQM